MATAAATAAAMAAMAAMATMAAMAAMATVTVMVLYGNPELANPRQSRSRYGTVQWQQ